MAFFFSTKYLHFVHLDAYVVLAFRQSCIAQAEICLCSDLGLDESQSLRAVDGDVLLVVICVVSIAAVRVLLIAVGLEDAGVCRRASEARGAGGELFFSVSTR